MPTVVTPAELRYTIAAMSGISDFELGSLTWFEAGERIRLEWNPEFSFFLARGVTEPTLDWTELPIGDGSGEDGSGNADDGSGNADDGSGELDDGSGDSDEGSWMPDEGSVGIGSGAD